jgi:hypothetical protein
MFVLLMLPSPELLLESIVTLLMPLTCRPTTRILGGSEAFLKQHK